MMASFVIALFVIIVFVFVIEPFLSTRKLPNRFVTKNQTRVKELQTRKENILENIREVDLENAMGKIFKDDYQKLRNSYVARLDTVTSELDRLGRKDGMSDLKKQIEEDIMVRRRTSRVTVPESNGLLCRSCSTENLPGSNFCVQCGAKLS